MSKFHIHKQHKGKNKFHWFWLILLLIPLFALITAVSSVLWYRDNLEPLSNDQTEIIVTIPVGATSKEIGELLEIQGVIKSSFVFDLYNRLNNRRDSLQAGAYKFMPSNSVEQIVDKLESGDVSKDLVLLSPAQTVDDLKSAFITAGFTREEVNEAFDSNLYKDHKISEYKPASASLEGYLYPESFQTTETTKLTDILRASLDEMYDAITPEMVESFAEKGLSVHQAIILASIIENEAPANSGDRPTIAQVYLKRLRDGMLLQADPTAQYGKLFATGTEEGWRYYDTPYNTYLYAGLPPGPISNVSKSSLQAIANPADSEYVYFVSGDDNKTYFSKTLEEHENAVRTHCIIKCASY
jgi:UPF0755 protein